MHAEEDMAKVEMIYEMRDRDGDGEFKRREKLNVLIPFKCSRHFFSMLLFFGKYPLKMKKWKLPTSFAISHDLPSHTRNHYHTHTHTKIESSFVIATGAAAAFHKMV